MTGTASTSLTGASGQSDWCLQKGSKSSKSKKKARPSFNELLAKYKRKELLRIKLISQIVLRA
jgi:hypothetical protein